MIMAKKKKSGKVGPSAQPSSVTSYYSNPALAMGATVGLLLVMTGTLMPVLGSESFYRWVYAAGAVMVLGCRLFSPYRGDNLRIKRLMRVEAWSGVFFCVGVFFQWYQGGSMRDWLAFTLAGAAIQIFTSIMIPREARKNSMK